MPVIESVIRHRNEAIPSSPPDLTESKSSKSSRSSCLTDATGPENLSHFEEIALADSGRNSLELHQHHQHIDRKLQRRQTGSVLSRQHTEPLRDSTNTNRPRRAGHQISTKMALRDQPRTRKDSPRLSRGHTSPSPITVSTFSPSPSPIRGQILSRSPSPNSAVSSTGSRSPFGSRTNSFSTNHRNFTKRSSTQPRKTIQELEAEYHDSDEDVPEDAVIWNVPISPRPPMGASPSPSPMRRASVADPNDNTPSKRLAQARPKHVEPPPHTQRPNMRHSVTLPALSGLHISASATYRTKSWTKELSEEARELTAALEAHAEAEREQESRHSSSGSSPHRSGNDDKQRSRTNTVELPPLQKGNVMIDPLPVSKEKEAVLSRTRPSWLPPKSQKEERKHLREWEDMMIKAAEADKRREENQVKERRAKTDMTHSIAKTWEDYILPNWDEVIRAPRTREMWWRGITPKCRGVAWRRAVGNELSLTEASYSAALGRAKALQASLAQMQTEEQQKHKDAPWLSAIARDVPTVLPELGIFGQEAPLHDTLVDVLLAYSAYRSDVCYVHGTHTIAGLLVLNMPAWEAFVTLANLLNRPMALAYIVNDHSGIKRAKGMVLATLKYKIPQLHAHLTDPKIGLNPEEWISPFLMTMGTMHLSTEVCSRLWDVFVFEGDKSVVRAIVGVLALLESKLYVSREEIVALLGWGATRWSFGEEEVMKAVREAGKVSPSSSQPQPQVSQSQQQ